MTDHTTTDPIRRTLRGALAAAVVPAALWATAGPAAAAPGPLSITGDGCTVVFTGEGYGSLELSMTYNGHTTPLVSTVMAGGSSEYGPEWLLPLGDTATFTVVGMVAGQEAASESIEMGSCTAPYLDASITITATEEGAPAPGSEYDVQLVDCEFGIDHAPIVTLQAGESAEIPVFPQRTYCPTPIGHPATVSEITVSSPSLVAGYGGHPVVTVHAVHTAPPVVQPPAEEPPVEEPAEEPAAPEPAEEPTAPAPQGSPVAPAAPAAPAAAQAADGAPEAQGEEPRSALPRTGGSAGLALAGAGLVATGRAVLRARSRLGGA